jgi:hypothetical protein
LMESMGELTVDNRQLTKFEVVKTLTLL